ncbi:HNH endonuclease [Sorangium sp. So ce1036]|uniref:HNH endonuclease n=1 Tax=Sorangium sp. So ce1036 TaxID=3133328 RepID=UPI003F522608
MCAVFGTKRQSPVTVSRVPEASFEAVLAFARDAASSAGSPGPGGREQSTVLRESVIPAELEEPTTDPNELDLRAGRLRNLCSLERPKGEQVPARSTLGARTLYVRSPIVKAWVLKEARGRCELCQQEAPFVGDDGEPYLELHHVLPLADGGADTVENAVALCPNCHRRLHHAEDRSERREHLYRQVSRLIRVP